VTAGAVVTAETAGWPAAFVGDYANDHILLQVLAPTPANGEAGQSETVHWMTTRRPWPAAAGAGAQYA
jgi:hypothetical protein